MRKLIRKLIFIAAALMMVTANAQEFKPYKDESLVLYGHVCDTFIMYSCESYDMPYGLAVTDENCRLKTIIEYTASNEESKYGFEGFLQSKRDNSTYLLQYIDFNENCYEVLELSEYKLNRKEKKPLCFPEFRTWGHTDNYIDFTMYTDTRLDINILKSDRELYLFPRGTEKYKTWDVESNPIYVVERISQLKAVEKKGNTIKVELAAEKLMMYALRGKTGVTLKDIRLIKDNYRQWTNYIMGLAAPAKYSSYPEEYYEIRGRSTSLFVCCYCNLKHMEDFVIENMDIDENKVIPYNYKVGKVFRERIENIGNFFLCK